MSSPPLNGQAKQAGESDGHVRPKTRGPVDTLENITCRTRCSDGKRFCGKNVNGRWLRPRESL